MVRFGGSGFLWDNFGFEYNDTTTFVWYIHGDTSAHSFAGRRGVGLLGVDNGPSSRHGDTFLCHNGYLARKLLSLASVRSFGLLLSPRSSARLESCQDSHACHSDLDHRIGVLQVTRRPLLGRGALVRDSPGFLCPGQSTRHGKVCHGQATIAN